MRPIRNCLNKQLTHLCQRSVQLEELSYKVSILLPPELAQTCQVAGFNKNCLVLNTTDAAWASQLRYAIPELRDKLREAGMYQLSSIKITMTESLLHANKSQLKSEHSISNKAKAAIINESQHCSYKPLQMALMNLGRSRI